MNRHHVLASSAALALASGALAGPIHDVDVFVSVGAGHLVTGVEDNGGFSPERVFGSEFGELAPNFTDEPGFDGPPGTFVPGSNIGFNIRKALRVWDGSDFDEIAPVQIEIGFGPVTPVVTPLSDVLVPGFSLIVEPNGEWHRHLEMTLLSPATDGVYLLEFELFSDQPGLGTSLPFWFVFNQNVGEEIHDAAIDYARENLVPAPGAAATLAAGALLASRRRRRS